MRLCVVSFKECWREADGAWVSYGGFPAQMRALATLFDETTLVVAEGRPRAGGMPLPREARVVALRNPVGADARRKLSLLAHLPYYLRAIGGEIRTSDAVHAPVPGDLPFLGMALATLLRKRLFVRYASSWVPDRQSTVMRRVTRAWMRTFAGGRNVMVALGPVGAGTVPAPRMHWLFVSVVTEAELATIRPDFERPPHAPLRLAYVGRLSSEKGIVYLLDALDGLRRTLPAGCAPPVLTLVGDGPQRAALETRAAALGLGDTVRFAGQLARADVLRTLLRSDVCVLPSLTEGFCKARLDAMLCGVPLVTTGAGFGRELVGTDGERGWIVPAYDAAALAGALAGLLRGGIDWPALRRRCRRYVEGQTIEAWTREIGRLCSAHWRVPLVDGRLRGGG